MSVTGNPTPSLSLEERLDALSRDVAEIAAYIREERARRESQRDLMRDLEHILPEVYGVLAQEFQDLEGFVQLEDLVHLGRVFLRNVRNLIWLLEQLESLRDLLRDSELIVNEAVPALIQELDSLEKRQYFAFFKEALRIFDNILTHYTPEDVRLLADNIVLIVDTIRELTQPDVMTLLQEFTDTFREVTEQPEAVDVSMRNIFRLLRDPHVRRGLVITMQTLRLISMGRGQMPKQALASENGKETPKKD